MARDLTLTYESDSSASESPSARWMDGLFDSGKSSDEADGVDEHGSMMGLMGAALATLISYAAGLLVCAVDGRRFFHLPMPLIQWSKALLATAFMGIVVARLPDLDIPLQTVILKAGIGALTYAVCALVLDIAGCREWIRYPVKLINKRRVTA